MARILIFGNSIPWGSDDLERGGWVDRFKTDFKKTGKFNEVFNLGNPGENSTRLLKRLENECMSRLKDESKEGNAIIIQTGMNDSQYLSDKDSFKTSSEEFKKNIQELIKISKKFNPNIVFVGNSPVDELKVNPIPWNKNEFCKNDNIKRYNQIIKSVCEKNNVYFIEIFEKLEKANYQKLLGDGLHPNSKGHEMIYEIVRDFLVKNKIL